jgi:hypothetical protein
MTFIICQYAMAPGADALNWDPPHITSFTSEVCFECHIHNPHHGTASYPAQLDNLCESCHFDGGPATGVVTHSSRTTDNDYGNWDLDCWACHHPHSQEQETWDSTYGKYIRRYLQAEIKEIDPNDPGPYFWPLSILRTVTSDIVEFKGPTEFVDGDGAADDDICQVCHENTHYYNKLTNFNTHADNGPDSQPGGVCTNCHRHEEGFSAAGCVSCHSIPLPAGSPYRRQVVGNGGDFERASHHVWEGAAESVEDSDCQVCHDQGNHQATADPDALLNDPDGGASIQFDGAGASLEDFCLNCHDAAGPLAYDYDSDPGNGRQPFTDGLTPADIDTSWGTAAHGVSTVTELLAEKCLACHGGSDTTIVETITDHNTHGSANPTLLSGLVAGETLANPHEELCFACHDGSPAATDIESMFAGTATATSNSGALLNTHHDISDAAQAYSGAVIECTDCHDPHATGVRGDPDPGDGRVPAAGNTWAGSSFISEFCLDCHDNSFPPSVVPPTNNMIDVYDMWTDSGGGDKADQHGPADASRNVNLRAGSGYARGDILQCTDCHNPGHGDEAGGATYTNLFNLKSIIYSKDGATPLTPDWSIPGEDPNLVRITDTSAGNADQLTNGRAFCSACHPSPMGGNKDKGCLSGNCHAHGEGSF